MVVKIWLGSGAEMSPIWERSEEEGWLGLRFSLGLCANSAYL